MGLAWAALLAATTGCSVKRFAINKLGDSLASSGTTYAADNDPELVGQALPFGLKLVEGLLAKARHTGLLFAAASGFTQYAYAYVHQDADIIEKRGSPTGQRRSADTRQASVPARARLRPARARRPASRVRPGARGDPHGAVRVARKDDVPLLYWTAASWGSAIGVSKDDPGAHRRSADRRGVDRSGAGARSGFRLGRHPQLPHHLRAGAPGAAGDPAARSRLHFDRAVALTNGQLAGPFVALAEAVTVQSQDRAEFDSLLKRALAIDPDARPEWRLVNLIVQRRARWLIERKDDLFAQ